MKKFSAVLFVLLPLSLFAQNYAQTITTANMDSASNKVANLQSCFGTDDGTALFDELYILGRTWQERIYQDYYKSTNISVAAFDALSAEEKELPDGAQYARDNNGSWVIGINTTYRRRVKEVIERREPKGLWLGFCLGGGLGNWDEYRTERDTIEEVNDTNLPENKIGAAEKDTYEPQSTCNGQYTSQIRRCTYYSWVDASGNDVPGPVVCETKIDTLGVLVQKINTIQFNPSYNRGELRPYDSAIERISATETVTVEGALGAGNERQGEWYVDEVEDEVFYTAVKDTVYTVLSYTPRTFQYGNASNSEYQLSYTYFSQKASNSKYSNVWSYTAAIWEANNIPSSSQITQFRTPCYVYKKNDNGYTFARVFDATKENIGKITTSGKKIYLTGRCISFNAKNPGSTNQNYNSVGTQAQASVGYDGPGFITIDCSGTTDLYIENLELQTKSPTTDAIEQNGTSQNVRTHLSAPVVLQADGNKTNIHIKGRNLLMGAPGRQLDLLGRAFPYMHGAAVYINAGVGWLSKDKIECTFDDKWPVSATKVVSTNGFLKLVGEQDQFFPAEGKAQRQASPIYMGNDDCKVTFDGGEYRFTPADASESTTTNNMIAATRKYSVWIVTGYNVGHCYGEGTLHFKSGTFSMTASVGNLTPIPPVSDGTNLMRVPAKSIIDGGTFNGCVVRRCVDYTSDSDNITCPQNSSGNDLFEFKITGDLNSEGYLDNLDLPTDEGYNYDYYNFTNCLPLQDENGDYYYSPYLPSNQRSCGEISVIQNWDVGFPSGLNSMISHEDRLLYMHTKEGNYLGTKRLAFIELNPYYPEVKSYTNSHITESKDYEISENVYLMTWSMSDKWRIITLPFDVSDVYVLETWATDDDGETADADKEFQYYTLAAQQIVIKGNLADLSKNVGSNNDFLGIYNSAVATTEAQVSEDDWRVAKKPYKMTYWRQDGTDTPANYYLYEAKGFNDDAKAIGLGSQFERVWEAVPRHEKDGNSIIMEKGKTYAIMFPNWVSSEEPGWNYWDGKYILFEGPGQTLSGTNSFPDVAAPENDNEFQFGGNPTFGFVKPSHPYVYTWDYKQQKFVKGATKQMSWLDSYMVANDATTRQLAKIGRRGNPSYDTSTDNRLQGATPLALEVYSMEGGLRFYAYVDQELTLIDMMGRVVASLNLSSNSSQDIQLPTGVYVVRSSQMDQVMKVVVK